MTSTEQIDANRENAQSSTGPTSEAGKQRSSLNSTVHGFTGRNLVFLSETERAKYEVFVKNLQTEFHPNTAESSELLQQYIDLRWSLQQITIELNHMFDIITATREQFMESRDFAGMNLAIVPWEKRIKTFGTYEQRRRRAAKETLEQFHKVEQETPRGRPTGSRRCRRSSHLIQKARPDLEPPGIWLRSFAPRNRALRGPKGQQTTPPANDPPAGGSNLI